MRFKYFNFSFLLLMVISCQKIHDSEPNPIPYDTRPKALPAKPFDSTYVAATCNTAADVIINGSVSFTVVKTTQVAISSTCSAYRLEDQYNTTYVMVYFRNQDLIPKCFKIIPYNTKFDIKNYNEAMILIHIGWSGTMDLGALSGTYSHNSMGNMGFCDVPFKEINYQWTYTSSLSF